MKLLNTVELSDELTFLKNASEPISAGAGILRGEENSIMQGIDQTTAEDYTALCRALCREGFKADFENRIGDNLFGEYSRGDQRIYLYYLAAMGKIRATLVRNGCACRDFSYFSEGQAKSEFVFFRMACDAEDTYLILCNDNSWIFIDGGCADYATYDDSLAEEVYRFMRRRSGLGEDEKLVISCWYMTHAHRDHMLAFSSMLKLYHDKIDLRRVLCNPPDHTKIIKPNTSLPWFEVLQDRIAEWYPDVCFLKVQTGMEIQLANVHFRILYTQQDHIEEWYTGKTENHSLNYNNSSVVAMITVDDMKILELADLFHTQEYVSRLYPMSEFECDILKVAHHYIDYHSDEFYLDLVERKKPDYALANSFPERSFMHKLVLRDAMGDGFLFGSRDTAYGFRKTDGAVEKIVYKDL